MPTWEDLQRAASENQSIDISSATESVVPFFSADITVPAESGLTLPQQRALESFQSRANLIVDEARTIAVTDQTSLERAAQFRQDLKAATDLFEALMRPEIDRYHKAHKEALARLKQLLSPWTTADTIVKSTQDAYHLRERREREEAARRLQAQLQHAREEELARQLAEAEKLRASQPQAPEVVAQADQMLEEVLVRSTAPPPVIPVVHTTTKAEGSAARVVHEFDLVDVDKIDPRFVMDAIKAEIGRTGKCEWLMTQIKREVVLRGKEAERTVGEGSIKYREGMSTGVRRKRT